MRSCAVMVGNKEPIFRDKAFERIGDFLGFSVLVPEWAICVEITCYYRMLHDNSASVPFFNAPPLVLSLLLGNWTSATSSESPYSSSTFMTSPTCGLQLYGCVPLFIELSYMFTILVHPPCVPSVCCVSTSKIMIFGVYAMSIWCSAIIPLPFLMALSILSLLLVSDG